MSIPPYYGRKFKCLVCGERTEEAPNGGVFLSAPSCGNYGSTVFDNNGPSGGVVAREPDEVMKWDPTAPEDWGPSEEYEE